LKLDASELPFPYRLFDLGVILHGIRSLGTNKAIIQVLRELLRVSRKIIIAESLPIAKTEAQKAHLDMYNLREPVFEAVFGKKDDYHYRTEKELIHLMKSSGAINIQSNVIEFDLPHHLAYFPKEIILKIENEAIKEKYLRLWNDCFTRIQEVGESHPPVCIISADPSDKFLY
jgi:hypothetical protein